MPKFAGLRADAAVSRERLNVEERRFFTAGDATVSMAVTAEAAGTGVVTPCRNLPTREALVEVVRRLERDALAADAKPLLSAYGVLHALRT